MAGQHAPLMLLTVLVLLGLSGRASSSDWSTLQVGQLLQTIGLGMYASRFEEARVDGKALGDLSDARMRALGIASMGHRLRLRRAIRRLSLDTSIVSPAKLSEEPRLAFLNQEDGLEMLAQLHETHTALVAIRGQLDLCANPSATWPGIGAFMRQPYATVGEVHRPHFELQLQHWEIHE